jgi:hypothetical protein
MKHKRWVRVLLTQKDDKDKCYMRGTYNDNKDFFDSLHLMFGETLFLQHYINNQWHTRLQRSNGTKQQEVNIKE